MRNDGRRFLGLLLVLVLFVTGQGCGSAPMQGDLPSDDDELIDDPGTLDLEVAGLPAGTDADVTVTHPDGTERTLSAGAALENLEPGDYLITAAAVLGSDGFGYRPDPASQTIFVDAGATAEARVAYQVSSGSLLVAVNGLSKAAEADLVVTGPNGFTVGLTDQSTVLTDLEPGTYTVETYDVTSDDADFIAQAPLTQSVFVNEGLAETINMSYSCGRVYIADPVVEVELRELTGKSVGDFDCDDLADVTRLDLYDGAQTFAGVQHIRNLESLRSDNPISEGGIDDLGPLRHLTSLVELYLADNEVSDLEPLANLENLQVLVLRSNAIALEDLTPLQGLRSLTELHVNDAGLTAEAIKPLSQLTQLEILHIDNNPLGDVSALAPLVNLEELNIGGSEVTDISPLADMVEMESLFLTSNEIVDIGPLAEMTNLRRLFLPGNPIEDLTALKGKTELEILYLFNTDITSASLQSLAGMTKLETLLIQFTSIQDIEPLGTLASLQRLDLSVTSVKDLSPLAQATELTSLNVGYTALSSLDAVAELGSLTNLIAAGNGLHDLSPLSKLENLTDLNLRDNDVKDLAPLSKLSGMGDLDLSGNKVTDLTGLGEMSDLRFLRLGDNFVTDLSPLADGTALEDGIILDLRCNSLDLSPGSDATADIAILEEDVSSVNVGPQRPDPSCN